MARGRKFKIGEDETEFQCLETDDWFYQVFRRGGVDADIANVPVAIAGHLGWSTGDGDGGMNGDLAYYCGRARRNDGSNAEQCGVNILADVNEELRQVRRAAVGEITQVDLARFVTNRAADVTNLPVKQILYTASPDLSRVSDAKKAAEKMREFGRNFRQNLSEARVKKVIIPPFSVGLFNNKFDEESIVQAMMEGFFEAEKEMRDRDDDDDGGGEVGFRELKNVYFTSNLFSKELLERAKANAQEGRFLDSLPLMDDRRRRGGGGEERRVEDAALPRAGDAAPPRAEALAPRRDARRDLDLFNRVTSNSNLTYQNVSALLRSSFAGLGNYDEMNRNGAVELCAIGGNINSLRDSILKFLVSDPTENDRAIFALCRGHLNNYGHIEGDTHWTALHLRRVNNDYGVFTIQPYYMDSMGRESPVPEEVKRVLENINNVRPEDLHGYRLNPELLREILRNTQFQACRSLPCLPQTDGYSCGYHAGFNLTRMQT